MVRLFVAPAVVLFLLVKLAHATITDGSVTPAWAASVTAVVTGTHCACDAFVIISSSTNKLFKSIRCLTFETGLSRLDIDVNYTCECMGMSAQCSYLSQTVTYEESDPEDLSFCGTYDANVTTDFASVAPLCTDAYGQACGETAGIRTDTQIRYVSSNITAGCRIDTVRIDCVTPVCGVNPDACVLNATAQPWSPCGAVMGQCKKSRAAAIVREAAHGAPLCPSLAQRTEYADCSTEECDLIVCSYSQKEIRGPCSIPCGSGGYRNVTMVNISNTALDRCTDDFETIIEQTHEDCLFNPPCVEETVDEGATGTPIEIICFTYGNAGHKGSHFEGVKVRFGIPITSNASQHALASSFSIIHTIDGRRMPVLTSGVEISNDTIILPAAVNPTDYEGTTGDQYVVRFRLLPDLNLVFHGREIDLPPFSCLTEDRSPPAMKQFVRDPASENLVVVFSEEVTTCREGEATVFGADFNVIHITMDDEFGLMYGLYETEEGGVYRHFYWHTQFSNASSELLPQIGAFCDRAGNQAYITGAYETVVTYNPNEWASAYVSGDRSGKLFSSSNNGLMDRLVVTTSMPVSKQYMLDNYQGFYVTFTVYNNVTSSIIVRYANSVKVVTNYLVGAYSDRFLFSFDPVNVTGQYYFDPDVSFYHNLVRGLISPNPTIYGTDGLLYPTGFTRHPTDSYVTAGDFVLQAAPVISSAKTAVGSNTLYVQMSKQDQDSVTIFTLAKFAYKGDNSIASILEIQNNSLIVFQMALNFTFEMLESDYVYFNGSATTSDLMFGDTPWRAVNVTNFNGVRPAVITAAAVSDANGTVWSSLRISFDSPIDPDTVTASTLTLTSNHPLITGFTVTDTTVSTDNKTVFFNLTATCASGVCTDTSGDTASILIQGITDHYGNKMTAFSTASAFDLAGPTLDRVVAIGPKALKLVFTETIASANLSLVYPKPTDCYLGGGSSAVCTFPTKLAPGTRIYIKADSNQVKDANGNVALANSEYGVTLQSAVPDKECNSPLDLPLAQLIPLIVAGAIGAFGTVAALAYSFKLLCSVRNRAARKSFVAGYGPVSSSD